MAFFSTISTLLQALIVALGGVVTVAYSFSFLHQTVQSQRGVVDWKTIMAQTTFSLVLVGLYGVFVYVFAMAKMSEGGFRTIVQVLGG
ncbi:MAG: hypothetical protein ABEK75_02610 [Salinibacter sp.]